MEGTIPSRARIALALLLAVAFIGIPVLALLEEFYLGIGGVDRKSFGEGKAYKRPERWLG